MDQKKEYIHIFPFFNKINGEFCIHRKKTNRKRRGEIGFQIIKEILSNKECRNIK